MIHKHYFYFCRIIITLLLLESSIHAQESISEQVWGNFVMGIPDQSGKLYVELDFEPKAQINGDDTWKNLDVTPLVEYYPDKWVDFTAEVVMGYTKQTNSVSSYEISPRLGIRLHIFGNLRQYIPSNNYISFSRFSLSTLLRYEYRSLWYNDNSSEHQSRFRFRLETKTAFNHKQYTHDNTYYLFADVEQYFNIGKDIDEKFSNKARGRIGPGYRYDDSHRFEILLIYDYARNTIEEDSRHDAFIIDARYIVYF